MLAVEMKTLTEEHITGLCNQWNDDLYPSNAEFFALCDMALEYLKSQSHVMVPEELLRSAQAHMVRTPEADAVSVELSRYVFGAAQEERK